MGYPLRYTSRVLAVCWLAVVLAPGVARAQDDFHRYFSAAVRLYNQGENEQALEQLQQAKARTFEVRQDVMVALYEGLILLELGAVVGSGRGASTPSGLASRIAALE